MTVMQKVDYGEFSVAMVANEGWVVRQQICKNAVAVVTYSKPVE